MNGLETLTTEEIEEIKAEADRIIERVERGDQATLAWLAEPLKDPDFSGRARNGFQKDAGEPLRS